MLKDFKEFAMRGSLVDMAVGIVIGVAFGAIIQSLVADVLMPPIGLLLGKVDFANLFVVLKEGATSGPYSSLASASAAGAVTINYGKFVNTFINFIIIALAMFFVVRGINRARRRLEAPAAATTRDCPFCYSAIPIKATRCPHCTSELQAAAS